MIFKLFIGCIKKTAKQLLQRKKDFDAQFLIFFLKVIGNN